MLPLQAQRLNCAPVLCSPNVDFYSGIVLRALGIPLSMYTVLFAVARTVGWVSQVSRPQARWLAHSLWRMCTRPRTCLTTRVQHLLVMPFCGFLEPSNTTI